jgi:glycosyltransferase involved in cell wall biosynthesis
LVVIEAAAAGTPSVVAPGPDNAAVELVEEGVNGFIADAADPEALGRAIVAAHRGGSELRRRTAEWFARNAPALSAAASAKRVVEVYDSARR